MEIKEYEIHRIACCAGYKEPAAVLEVKRLAHACKCSDDEEYHSGKHASDKSQIK